MTQSRRTTGKKKKEKSSKHPVLVLFFVFFSPCVFQCFLVQLHQHIGNKNIGNKKLNVAERERESESVCRWRSESVTAEWKTRRFSSPPQKKKKILFCCHVFSLESVQWVCCPVYGRSSEKSLRDFQRIYFDANNRCLQLMWIGS